MKLQKVKNGMATIIIWALSMVTVLPLILVVGYIIYHGSRHLSFDLITKNPVPVGEEGGGVLNGIVGSGMILAVAAVIGIPLGLLGGMYLAEAKRGKLKQSIRLSVEILQGVPSIIIGIVVYVMVVRHSGFSAMAGGIALAIMMLPIIVISAEEVLQLVPLDLKEAGIALGMPRWRVSLFVMLKTGLGGVISGILLSLSRVAGETAPLLFTAFGSQYLSFNLDKPIAALPLQIFNYSISPYPEWHALAMSASFLLLVFILVVNIITRVFLERMNFVGRR